MIHLRKVWVKENFVPAWFSRDVFDTFLSNSAQTVCLYACNMLHKCIFLLGRLADGAQDMSGCVFQSLWSPEVPMSVFCSLSAVWTVSHTCQTHPCMNGRLGSHSLHQPFPATGACADVCMCWRVLTCVFVLPCWGVGCGRVGGPCPIYNNCQLSVTNTSSVLLPVKGRWGTLCVFPSASNRGSDHLSFIGSVHWRTLLSLWDAKFHLQSSLGQGNRSKVFLL